MKHAIIVLVVAIGTITITYPADANEVNVSDINKDYGQASALTTQPIAIMKESGNGSDQTDRLRQIADSIPAEQGQASQSINPLDFFKDPAASLERLTQENRNQTPEKVDPLEFIRVPALPSSYGLPVTRF